MIRRHALLALMLLVTALLAVAPGPAESVGQDPTYGAPDAGACYDVPLSAADKNALRDETVACSSRHTLWIVGVPVAPKSVKFDGSMRFWRFVVKACSSAQDDAIGHQVDRYLTTVYQNFFFLPTKAQQRNGAHWISCELGWLVGNEKLRAHPGRRSAATSCRHVRRPGPLPEPLPGAVLAGARLARGLRDRGAGQVHAGRHHECSPPCVPAATRATRRWAYSGGESMGLDAYSLTCYDRSTH